jgi:ABC-2 type transport system ATP-binding protein
MNTMTALTITNLTKTYANGTQALKGISLTVEKGDFFALLGPNGAGKSSTIGIVTSLVNKTAGQISVFGDDLDTQMEKAKSHIGLVPQEFNCNIFETVLQILLNQAGYYGVPRSLAHTRAEYYLRKLSLWEQRNMPSRMLSGGMKRRLMIARALVHEPQLLILDEPTAGVDIEIRRAMWDFLRELNQKGITIILTTHYLEEAENLCKKIAIIDKGLIVENTDMQSLLKKLELETFILYLKNPIKSVPHISNIPLRLIDELTLEADISHHQILNELFNALSEQGLQISSMRNKSNRLEELFIRLVSKEIST